MSDNFVKHALENGGSIHPLLVPSDYLNGPSITNPSIYNDDGKILVNLRNINYTLYHSEKKKFEHHWDPLVYIHPENDLRLRTKNIMCEMDETMSIKRYHQQLSLSLDWLNHKVNSLTRISQRTLLTKKLKVSN